MDQDQHPTTTERADASPNRRRAAIGVTAGLLAGGAIGLFAVAPAFSSAATPDVAAVQDTSDDTSDRDDTDDSTVEADETGHLARGTRLREALQPLVDDGTIDAAQADAVASHLAELRPEREHHGPRRGMRPGFDGDIVADLIGIDVDSLREQLRDGESIAEIAEANGVDPQAVIDALVEEGREHLDLAVESGRLTADEAAEKAADLEARVTARVNGERPSRPATN